MKYPKLKDGESFKLYHKDEDLDFACCDCGMVHLFIFDKVRKDTMNITLNANRKATAQLRFNEFGDLHKNNKKWILKRR